MTLNKLTIFYIKFIAGGLFLLQLIITPANGEILAYSTDLKKQLSEALKSMPGDYQPRTKHFCDNNLPCYTNCLLREVSPY